MSKKLAVFFPGRKYGVDCPLLYYSDYLCRAKGYDTMYLHYAAHREEKSIMTIEEEIENAKTYVRRRLMAIDVSNYEEILFVSKSIGTVLAAYFQTEKNLKVRNLYFTPLEQTLPYFAEKRQNHPEDNFVIAGTKDPFLKADKLKEVCEREQIHYYQVEGVGHSMEGENIEETLEYMKEIMKVAERFIEG
jgi:hypothetical protein